MRKLFVLVSVCLVSLLAGCQGYGGLTQTESEALTPEQRIFKLANEINIAFEPAVAYAQQPRCTEQMVIACHDPVVVRVLLELREEANSALETARLDPDAAAVTVLTQAVRRILAQVQAELLKAKTSRLDHVGKHAIAFA